MRRRFTGNKTFDINYFTIVALEDGLTVSLTNVCEYCINGSENWKSLSYGTHTDAVSAGQTLSFRGNLTPNSREGIGTFNISKKCNLKGNIMSMLFGDDAAVSIGLGNKTHAFHKLFSNCQTIVDASELKLPSTILSSSCYATMFYGCTNLTTAPELPAITLADSCYSYMFTDCPSLTFAPKLPSTSLADNCYNSMFANCTSLVTSPELPSTILSSSCYANMFYGCTNLTTAPELPANVLMNDCYRHMFYGCINLNYIKMLATDISANSCLTNWVSNVSSTGTFVKNPAMTSLPSGSSGIPSGWTVKNNGDE